MGRFQIALLHDGPQISGHEWLGINLSVPCSSGMKLLSCARLHYVPSFVQGILFRLTTVASPKASEFYVTFGCSHLASTCSWRRPALHSARRMFHPRLLFGMLSRKLPSDNYDQPFCTKARFNSHENDVARRILMDTMAFANARQLTLDSKVVH